MCVCVSGVCREGERLVVGPTDEGRFMRLRVGSIHRNRSACRVLRAGQAATLALGNFDRSLLRKVRGHMTFKLHHQTFGSSVNRVKGTVQTYSCPPPPTCWCRVCLPLIGRCRAW